MKFAGDSLVVRGEIETIRFENEIVAKVNREDERVDANLPAKCAGRQKMKVNFSKHTHGTGSLGESRCKQFQIVSLSVLT